MKLFKHQEDALVQTEQFNRVGYFLDMGLGKTFVGSEKMWELNTQTNLIVCQKSKVEDWVEHMTENYSLFYTICNLTNKKGEQLFKESIEHDDVIGVINYDLLFRRSYITHISSFTLMLDESQLIQNESAKRTKFILKLNAKNVILLSGTPTSGKYENLWTQCKLLGWNITKKAFWNSFVDTEWIENNDGFKLEVIKGYKNVSRLKRKLADHGVVFMKTEEAFQLPEQKDINIKIKASKEYWKFMKNSIITMQDKELVGDCILTKMLYARQLCGQYSKDKMEAFKDLVESTDDRLIVFYNFTQEVVELCDIATELNRPQSIVCGNKKSLKNYEQYDNSITFIQYQAGAMGLNLQKANKIIYFTLPLGKGSCGLWEQSKKRIHRIGQAKTCFYYYLLCTGSIEEKNLDNLKIGKEYNDQLFEKEFT